MKKKPQNFRQDFKMPHLFREDLEKLENILKELGCNYKLETSTFEYDTVEEIPKDLESVREFVIQTCSPPYISIEFRHYMANIYIGDDDIKTIGAAKKIIEVISNRERKFLYWLSKFVDSIAFYTIFLILLIAEVFLTISKFSIKWYLLLTLVLVITLILLIVRLYVSNNFSLIEFIYRKDRPNFFAKNKDQIILITIGALLGALATIIFQKIFR